MVRRAGFEPATSRLADEVTAIFTTDRVEAGGELAMLLPLRGAMTELRHFYRRDLNPRPPSRQSGAALYRSNRHLHHRLADDDASANAKHAGEQAISVSVTSTQALPCRTTGAAALTALARPPPRCVTSKAGFEPALSRSEVSEIFTTSVGRAAMRQTKITKQVSWRRRERRAAIANPSRFALPSVSGLRLVPSGRPRAFGRAPAGASPGIRVSRSGVSPGYFE